MSEIVHPYLYKFEVGEGETGSKKSRCEGSNGKENEGHIGREKTEKKPSDEGIWEGRNKLRLCQRSP